MYEGFDLRDEQWIPVRLATGEAVRVGLRQLFKQAHRIADLEVPVPPAASGLLRILAVLTARIAADHSGVCLGDPDLTDDIDDWMTVRDKVLHMGRFDPDAVDAYLNKEVPAGRFDLFDPERPFLQDPRLIAECVDPKGKPNPSGVNKLVFGRPTGTNGAVLFGHFADGVQVPIPADEAVWHLIAQLYFGPFGRCTARDVAGHRAGNSLAAPLRRSVSYFPWAPDLFSSLVLAVPRPVGEDTGETEDACPWETELPDPVAVPPPVTWPGRLLTGRFCHAVLLVPSADRRAVIDAYVTWATRKPAQEVQEPYLILDRNNGELRRRSADGTRALWRDVDALLLKDSKPDALRPPCLESLPTRFLSRLRVRAYGFEQDPKKQVDNVWFQATTPPLLHWQEEHAPGMTGHIARCHRMGEEAGARLDYAAMVAWKIATDPKAADEQKVKIDRRKPGPWAGAALTRYWPAAEREFWRLATPEGREERVEHAFVDAALAALDAAIGEANRADLRVARARSRARVIVRALLPQPAQQL